MATQEYDFLIDKVGRQSTWSVSLNYALLSRPEIYEIFPHSDNHNNNNSNNNNIIMVIVCYCYKNNSAVFLLFYCNAGITMRIGSREN